TRTRGERDRELEEPLLAVGERIRRDVLLRREADEVDHTVGLRAEHALLGAYASAAQQRGDEADITAQMQAGEHVLADRQPGEQARLLERAHETARCDAMRPPARDRDAFVEHPA